MSVQLESTEKDTLGVDARTPRCIHAGVLDASEMALERFMAAQGPSAEAFCTPIATSKSPNNPAPKNNSSIFISPSLLQNARVGLGGQARGSFMGSKKSETANELEVIEAAEAAWVKTDPHF